LNESKDTYNDHDPFLWGVATSSFQIEGHIKNDMTEWEKSGKFKQDGKNPLYKNGCNHWEIWEKDFELLSQLKVNSYRFSLEWSRIQPTFDTFNDEALQKYRKMIEKLTVHDITPFLTLNHFSHPNWFHKECPWHEKKSVEVYLNFVRKVLEISSDLVNWYVTFNEPLVWVLAAYGDAKFPPGERNFKKMMHALTNILHAHREAYQLIKETNKKAQIGIAKNFIIFKPTRKWNQLDVSLSKFVNEFYNTMIPTAFSTNRLKIYFPLLLNFDKKIQLKDMIDFWGINYYYRLYVNFRFNFKLPFEFKFKEKAKEGHSDLGWENHSKGLYKIAKSLRSTNKPLVVTENGIATTDDKKRIDYLKSHFAALKKIQKKGLPIKGYFYWSFLDNYEWLEGKTARFGLIGVDYDNNNKRMIKPSGYFFSRYFIKNKSNFKKNSSLP
jgi:beta-glucosidase